MTPEKTPATPPNSPAPSPEMPQKDAPPMPHSASPEPAAEFLPPQPGEPTPWMPASEAEAPVTPETAFGAPQRSADGVYEQFQKATANLQPLPVRMGRVRRRAAVYAAQEAVKRVITRS